ncbi:unnamed protein product [Linum trigynum]|uniref:Uncharacterized protein n=1 Tax=Linum trigynum TaxID=586398 RepID=A0AAV2C7I6_9ROSI
MPFSLSLSLSHSPLATLYSTALSSDLTDLRVVDRPSGTMIACGDYDCSGIRFCLDEATVTQVARPPHLICEASDELKEFETVQLSLVLVVVESCV